MSDQTTDPRERYAEICAAADALVAAAVTWWGDQIATQDMPDGPERDLAMACDAYVQTLGLPYDRAAAAERITTEQREQVRLTVVRNDMPNPAVCHHAYVMVAGVMTCRHCDDRVAP